MDAACVHCQVVLGVGHLLGEGVSVGCLGGVEDGVPGHDLIGQLHVARPFPAALPEEDVHQEAGADLGTLAHQLGAEGRLGGVVGPEEVLRGVVIAEALVAAAADVDAQGIIGRQQPMMYLPLGSREKKE